MPKPVSFFMLAAVVLFLYTGCDLPGSKDKSAVDTTSQHASSQLFEVSPTQRNIPSAQLPEAIYEMPPMRGKTLAELVDCRQLAALLPDSLPNMRRDDMTAERAINDSVLVSLAAGSYADSAGNNIEIKITDPGNLSIFAAGFYPWLSSEIQSETETGYERTIIFNGFRGFERYYVKDQSGEMYLIVGERFLVEVTGYGVLSEDFKNAVSHIDLKKLEAMQAQDR